MVNCKHDISFVETEANKYKNWNLIHDQVFLPCLVVKTIILFRNLLFQAKQRFLELARFFKFQILQSFFTEAQRFLFHMKLLRIKKTRRFQVKKIYSAFFYFLILFSFINHHSSYQSNVFIFLSHNDFILITFICDDFIFSYFVYEIRNANQSLFFIQFRHEQKSYILILLCTTGRS